MQFYVMQLEVGSPYETWCETMEPVRIGEIADCAKCPNCGQPIGSLPWLPPYRATLRAYGKQLGDVAFGGSNTLVSEKFRIAWTEAKLRGIETFHPLERIRVRPARLGKKTPTYYYIDPVQFGTRADFEHSRIELAKPFACKTCLDEVGVESVRGFAIDEASWTGEDIFIAWGMPGSTIVTDRVRQLRDEHDLKNVTLIPTEKFFWDPYRRWSVIDYSPDEPPPEADEVVHDDDAHLN